MNTPRSKLLHRQLFSALVLGIAGWALIGVQRAFAAVDGGVKYSFLGDPSGVDYHNTLQYHLGVGYDATENINLHLFYEESQAPLPSESNPESLHVEAWMTVNPRLRFVAAAEKGLSSASADNGFTVKGAAKF